LPLRLLLEIEIAERLSGRVFHDEGLGVLLDDPRRREAARGTLRYSPRVIKPALPFD
jgi:hypothetical protein